MVILRVSRRWRVRARSDLFPPNLLESKIRGQRARERHNERASANDDRERSTNTIEEAATIGRKRRARRCVFAFSRVPK